MQIQVHTDHLIEGGEALAKWVQGELQGRLSRFKEYTTRVDVFLSDTDARKTQGGLTRCVLETRVNGRQPTAVNAEAEKIADAVNAATEKLMRALESELGRLKDKNGRETIRTQEPLDE
ncbi:HPF/RaiA family ribosome-associated protein [Comamonas endophytica]|uniref:HPF/RaiA family ribosome-associated protein n=1 Tax=Comamonas endophytica TaxID=2949090 RepID=A0ABY6G5T7_9BURK|nr:MULTISPECIES: HPF/RaiA family ribosome-associated protein [unclassified Acidovorax]MCD2512275.1 HPF/RaiA family ribosome-associated protein [Acidovorax sp. D4N7]UYG50268.1 HPF/RaiA family ribosome-associated protein [Acidovorax sp. 5MLIR]